MRYLIVWPVAAASLLLGRPAIADDNDPSAIELRLKQLESSPEKKAFVAEPCRNARAALKRVADARAAGDASHAVELAALANDWAKVASDQLRSVELDAALKKQQARALESEQKRRRTEILLEATIAQRERSAEQLRRVQAAAATEHEQSPAVSKGKDSKGKDSKGKDSKGKDSKGKDGKSTKEGRPAKLATPHQGSAK
jgi:hypothetical protein